MLDTVILQLDIKDCHISDFSKFGTTKEQLLATKIVFYKWINNPTKQDKDRGIYKPRLTLIKRGLKFTLKIEFSVAKLLYNNNLDEVQETNFDEVIRVLRDRICDMGIIIWSQNLEKAEVLSFHPSKNVPLQKRYTANMAIKELSKVDISKRFDLDEKKYRNNGEIIQFYTRSHAFTIYDKITDLKKSQRRAIDKDQTIQQLSIFEYIKTERKELEMLRLEIRLSLRRKMNEILEKIGYNKNPTFKDIFKKDLCQKILNLYWNELFEDSLFVLNIHNDPQDILQMIFRKFPQIKVIKAINIVGLYMLCKDEEGMRGFRQLVDNYKPTSNWPTVKRYLKVLEDEIFTNSVWGFVQDIKRELSTFEAYKLDLQCKEK